MDLFHKLNKEDKRTIIIITHNMELAKEAGRIYKMTDGLLEEI